MSADRSQPLPLLQAALFSWEYEGGALATQSLKDSAVHENVAQSVNTELDHLHIRVIAMENLLIALLAQDPDRAQQVGSEMATFISPRPGFTRHPRTLGAAAQILNIVERALYFKSYIESERLKNAPVSESEPVPAKMPPSPISMAATNSECDSNSFNISALHRGVESDLNGQTTNFRTSHGRFPSAYETLRGDVAAWPSAVCLPAQHESRLFLLNNDDVQSLANDRYVALVRGGANSAKFAGQRFILVDWYLRLNCGHPAAIVNETCSWLVFNAYGLLDFHAAHAIDAPAVPTKDQWVQLQALVFGDAFLALGR